MRSSYDFQYYAGTSIHVRMTTKRSNDKICRLDRKLLAESFEDSKFEI